MRIAVQKRTRRPPTAARLQSLGRAICAALSLDDAELSIVITDDRTIRGLNRTWRGKDKPTDVLSFSQVEGEGRAGRPTLGDVVISVETAARQAERAGISLDHEVRRLLVHGVLHLLGHDHVHGGRQATKMKCEERRILRALHRLGPA